MKKYILLFSILILTSCGSTKQDIIKIPENSWTVDNIIENSWSELPIKSSTWISLDKPDVDYLKDIDIYSLILPENLELESDLMAFNHLIDNDKKYFEKIWEIDYYYIWRDILFWDNNTSGEAQKLLSCIKWEIWVDKLLDDFNKSICKWENVYVEDGSLNFYHIKDTISKFIEAKEGKINSCDYFVDKDYDYPANIKVTYKLVDYIICNKLKDFDNYSIDDNYFYYKKASEYNNCNLLTKDKSLAKICDEIYEENPNKGTTPKKDEE